MAHRDLERKTRRGAAAPALLPANWNECERGELIAWENRRVRSELVCFGEVMYQPGGHCGPRQQRDYQLVFLHSGELTVRVDEHVRRVSSGQVGLFVPGRNEYFSFSEQRETHHSWCSVAPARVSANLRRVLASAPAVLACDEVQASLLTAGMALGRVSSEIEQSIVDQIGLALLGAYAKAGVGPADGGAVALAVRYMQRHLTEADCLQQAHLAAGVSRNTLISHFRAELGTTPARHLWRLRAEQGIAMLADTGHTVAEIAYACGFGDPFHFSRLVKSVQGVSPTELRRKLWSPTSG